MRKPSQKQQFIIDLINKSEDKTVTKKEICKHIRYYNNTGHYVGLILSSMVNQGMLIRIKPGLFKKGGGIKEPDKNQTNLF